VHGRRQEADDYLATRPLVGARALRWTILTAVRSGSTYKAKWREIGERDGKPVWLIPGEHMKDGNEFAVPLTPEMLAIIGPRGADNAPIFVGGAGGSANVGTMYQALRRHRPGLTLHGFRSAFRSWGMDCPDFPREVLEMALAHRVGGKTEKAYARSAMLERRREVMERWASFALSATVVEFEEQDDPNVFHVTQR
jgi:integrase